MPIRFRNRFTIKANRIISSTIKNFGKIKIIPGVFALVRSRTTVYGEASLPRDGSGCHGLG